MRNLIIGGDSFTLGSELEGKSWAELLGDKLGYKNTNVSIAGVGNATIARRVLEALPLDNSVVAVMWTFIARFDHYVDGECEQLLLILQALLIRHSISTLATVNYMSYIILLLTF